MSSDRTSQSGASGPPLPPTEVRWPPHRIHSLPLRTTCRIVRQVVGEMVLLFGDRVLVRRDRRRLACHVVEDRRDDPVFDDFISAIERIVVAVFGTLEVAAHDG